MTAAPSIRRVLVANRGEIAVRVVRACVDENIEAVAAHSAADADSLAVQLADRAIQIGPAQAGRSYLNVGAIVCAALATGCDAVHPGYGFLSERPELAEACAANGLTFIGPDATTIRRGGDKIEAREVARSLGIPVGGGSDAVAGPADAALAAAGNYPILLKAAAGGGGRGMLVVRDPTELDEGFRRAAREAQQAFGDDRVFVEHFVQHARHVEVQILADQYGNTVHLGDRDCSVQRRHQKLVEEAPAADLAPRVRAELAEAAVALAKQLGYVGAGTVEFLVDKDRGTLTFLEINTRLQVEHPVTEVVTGIDIVREQLRIAGGSSLPFRQSDIAVRGHAIEVRVNAEAPERDFVPSPGTIRSWVPPVGENVRVDTHCYPGYRVPGHYDSLLAKVIAHGDDREHAMRVLRRALGRFEVTGIDTTLPLHRDLLDDPDFRTGAVTTRWLEEVFLPRWVPHSSASPASGRTGL